jgi:hypothetical protein
MGGPKGVTLGCDRTGKLLEGEPTRIWVSDPKVI